MNIVIHGCGGRMGRTLADATAENQEYKIAFGVDSEAKGEFSFPVYENIEASKGQADVIIDFSHPSAIKNLLGFSIIHKMPVVISTTGLGPEEHRIIQEASKQIPIFLSPNMSIGTHALCKVLPQIMDSLGSDFDSGIIELHHKHKKDAPSGTAYLLKDHMKEDTKEVVALRLGSIPGEHKLIFAGPDELVELSHRAYSRKIFAYGALKAAAFIIGKKPGLYSMDDLV